MTAPWELPQGWEWRTFADVATIASNLVDPADYPDHPHLAPNHIVPETGRHVTLSTVTEDGVTSGKHLFEPGQIIYSKIRPYLRKATIARTEGLCSADMYPIETELEARYLMWWMLSGGFTSLALKGRSVIPKINQRELNALPVPVPPLAEQRAIVETIERMLSKMDAALAGVTRVESQRAILEASALHQIVSMPDTPSAPLSDLAQVVAGPAFKSAGFASSPEHATRLVRGSNVAPGRLHWGEAETAFWPNSNLEAYETYLLRDGDVLLAMDRPVISAGLKLATVTASDLPALLVQRVARIRPSEQALGRWIYLCLLAPDFIPHMLTDVTGTQLPHITLDGIRRYQIPRPPDSEIRDRIAQADMALRRSERLGRVCCQTGRRGEQLRRSIFKAAFEGRLTRNVADAQSLDDLQEAIA